MPIWLYQISTFVLAVLMVGGIMTISLIGLVLARRFVLPHFKFHDGVNDAVSGAVQAIGVFYGVTVGLIAVAVWNNYSNALDITAREATTAAALYSNIKRLPEPTGQKLRTNLYEYLVAVI